MDVELRHLRAFVAVARLSSFTRAAQQLLITQPALTRTIQQLENAMQVTLLDRNSRHVQLTPAGRDFLGPAERVLASLQNAVIEVAVIRGRVPATGTGTARVRNVHLFNEARVAVCSERSSLAACPAIDWHDIPDWPLVVNTVSGTTGPWSWPDGRGPRRVIETRNFDEWLESVAADRGIGVVPDVAMRRSIHPAVRFIPLTGAPPSPVSLAFLPHVREPLMRQFVEAAVTAAGHAAASSAPGDAGSSD